MGAGAVRGHKSGGWSCGCKSPNPEIGPGMTCLRPSWPPPQRRRRCSPQPARQQRHWPSVAAGGAPGWAQSAGSRPPAPARLLVGWLVGWLVDWWCVNLKKSGRVRRQAGRLAGHDPPDFVHRHLRDWLVGRSVGWSTGVDLGWCGLGVLVMWPAGRSICQVESIPAPLHAPSQSVQA